MICSSDCTHAVSLACLRSAVCTSATSIVVTVSPGCSVPYSQAGVSGLIPRSQVSSTALKPSVARLAYTSSSAGSGPLFVATIVNVTAFPTLAWRGFTVLDTTARSAVGQVADGGQTVTNSASAVPPRSASPTALAPTPNTVAQRLLLVSIIGSFPCWLTVITRSR